MGALVGDRRRVWVDTAPASSTFTFKGTTSDVYKFQYLRDDESWVDVAVTAASVGTSAPTASWTWSALTAGSHRVQVRTVDKAGHASATTVFTFGAGGSSLVAPVDGTKTTDKITVRATGPADANGAATATAYYRVAGGAAGAGDGTATGGTTGWSAIDGSASTFAVNVPVSYSKVLSAAQIAQSLGKERGTLQLQVQVCIAYTSGATKCTWNSTASAKLKPTITRIPSAFGDDFPTAAAGPGQVALWTGEFQTSATDASAPGYSGSLSVSRSYSSLAAPDADSVFGPGWTASFEGADVGVAGWQVFDNTATDGTISLLSGEGDVLIYKLPKTAPARTPQWVGTYQAADQDTKEAGAVLAVAAGSPKTLTFTDPDGVKTFYAFTGTDWQVTSVSDPADPGATQYVRIPTGSTGAGQIGRILSPAPTGVTCSPALGATLVKGCHALDITYQALTVGTASKTVVAKISYIAWDPDKAAMASVDLATYSYDSAGRLAKVTDPRTGLATAYAYGTSTSDSGQPLLTGITPAGQAAYTLVFGAVNAASPDGTASSAATVTQGLQAVKRVGSDGTSAASQIARFVYSVNPAALVTGLPDVRPTVADDATVGVGRWGQTEKPTYGVAVFGPDRAGIATSAAGSVVSADWPYADLQYTRSDGRVVNTAAYRNGGWRYTATDYDTYGNAAKSWDERGIEGILAEGDTDAGAVDSYATVTAYNTADITSTAAADGPGGAGSVAAGATIAAAGTRVVDAWSAATDAGEGDGAPVRTHTHTDYDTGAPNHGVNPATGLAYGLATSVTTTRVDSSDTSPASGETVIAKSTTGYAPIDGSSATGSTSGWTLGSGTVSTTVTNFATGAGIVTKTAYDAAGHAIKTVGAKDAAAGTSSANTQVTTYYTAGGSGTCGGHPEWAGLVCQTSTAESSPTLPVTTTAYGYYLTPTLVTETRGAVTRTTRTWYDTAGRATDTLTSTTGLATAAPVATTTHYNGAGLVDYTAAINPATIPSGHKPSDGGTQSGRTSTTYDSWGRTTAYVDASGATTKTGYVPGGSNGAGSVASVAHLGTDGTTALDTTTYSYDAAGQTVGQVTTLGTAKYAYAATYTPAGDLATQTMPAGIVQTDTYSRDGQLTGLAYDGPDSSGTTVPLLAWTVASDVQGRTVQVDTNAGSGEDTVGRELGYTYDNAGRLTNVVDELETTCQTRTYGFDVDGNRTAQSTTTVDGGDCTASTGTATVAKTWPSIDAADRLLTGASVQASAVDDDGVATSSTVSAGGAYAYDLLGRVTTLPAVDTPAGAGAGDLTLGYFDTDAARTITQGSTTTTYTLDPGGRRATSTVTTTGSDTVTVARHYDDGGDNPAWATSTTGSAAAVTSDYGSSIGGDLGLTITGGVASLALADPHGDTVTTVTVPTDGSVPQLGAVACYDEYGNTLTDLNQTQVDTDGDPVDTTTQLDTGAISYGWLGAKQRATDGSGLVLMGARLYNSATGQFTSVDPLAGGNTTAYAYPQDPINSFDFDGRFRIMGLTLGEHWMALKIEARTAYQWRNRAQASLIGWGTALYSVSTGGSCRQRSGLRVCQGGWGHLYTRGGTTWGTTYVAPAGEKYRDPLRLNHEKVHVQQWQRYGEAFGPMYLMAGKNACRNKYEIQANLTWGHYSC